MVSSIHELFIELLRQRTDPQVARDKPTVKERKSVGLGCMGGKTMFLNSKESIEAHVFNSLSVLLEVLPLLHTHTTLVA